MQDKVNLYYEGQQGRLALRCCMRLVWGDVNFVISAQRYSDSPQEAQVALLETLGQRYINLSKEAERHQQRALELEAQLGDALRSAEIARDERDEFEQILNEKDERILDLERQLLELRQHHDQLMASSTRQWQLRGEAGLKALNAEQRVKELEEQLAERDQQIHEANVYTRDQVIELAALRARNAELESVAADNLELREDMAVMRRDQRLLVEQLEKVVTVAKVVIDSSKKVE